MRLACYADDPREPELVGEVMINLKDVLTKGETDGVCDLLFYTTCTVPCPDRQA